jgi:hypothetical protein
MKLRFQTLQDNLRAFVWARLERGEVSGKALARQAGFQQAHLSNFLNARRGLSLQTMDRLLDVLHMDVLDLTGSHNPQPRQSARSAERETQLVALVSPATAAAATRFTADQIQDAVTYQRSFLRRLKPRTIGNRRDWTRFVVIKVDRENGFSMAPLLNPGALVLLDRYYNAPPLSDPGGMGLYLVAAGDQFLLRRVTVASGSLVLRPVQESPNFPLQVLNVPAGRRYGDFIIGRARHVSMEI